jgi:hypothetical protein
MRDVAGLPANGEPSKLDFLRSHLKFDPTAMVLRQWACGDDSAAHWPHRVVGS